MANPSILNGVRLLKKRRNLQAKVATMLIRRHPRDLRSAAATAIAKVTKSVTAAPKSKTFFDI